MVKRPSESKQQLSTQREYQTEYEPIMSSQFSSAAKPYQQLRSVPDHHPMELKTAEEFIEQKFARIET